KDCIKGARYARIAAGDLRPCPRPFPQPLCSAMLSMHRCCTSELNRRSQSGIWYTYHRKTGTRIHAEFGTAEFFQELAVIEGRVKRAEARPGSLGMVIEQYKRSSAWAGLAPPTRTSYQRAFEVLKPLADMPLVEIDRPFIVALREEKVFPKRGRWMANYVVTVLSLLFEY